MTFKTDLTVFFVSCATPKLDEIVIRSFNKFSKKSNFNIKFLIVENTSFDLRSYLNDANLLKDCIVVQNDQKGITYSHGHGAGLEFAKHMIDTEYLFTCHSDVCVTSTSFFNEIEKCINEDVHLAAVCEDTHPDRVKGFHCSGLLSKTDLFKKISLMPVLPKIDTTDLLTVYCRENGLKMKLFKNTYNDSSLCDICDTPYRELGKTCGVDRCLDTNNKVMFIHQGRGTTKTHNMVNTANGKMRTDEWIKFCESIIK